MSSTSQSQFGEKWLIERNHVPDYKVLWDPKRRNLYLLNLSGDETKILCLQIRPIVKKNSGSKYYTYKLSGIYKVSKNFITVQRKLEIIRQFLAQPNASKRKVAKEREKKNKSWRL